MKVLIDIGHPAHVHLFKNFALEMLKKGNSIFFTCREKEFETYLLEKYGFEFHSFGRKYRSAVGKLWGLIEFDIKELIRGLKFKPDIFLSAGSMYAAHAAFLLRKPHISLEDTFNFEQIRLYKPFTKIILTGDYENPLNEKKVIKYSGYHELAYLHPNWFSADESVIKELNVDKNEKYVIIRFVSWKASHDMGHKGISFDNKILAVKEFNNYAKVFISSEEELPPELSPYKIKIAPYKMHDAIAFASLVIGESFTMLSEAAVLGTPAVLIHDTKSYYLREQQKKYGLTFNFTESEEDQFKAIEKGIEILKTSDIKEEWQRRRNKMLTEKIDVTAFLIWFVENYPDSAEVMRKDSEYSKKFR